MASDFIQLSDTDNRISIINLDSIVCICEEEDGTCTVYLADDTQITSISNPIMGIWECIKNAY